MCPAEDVHDSTPSTDTGPLVSGAAWQHLTSPRGTAEGPEGPVWLYFMLDCNTPEQRV